MLRVNQFKILPKGIHNELLQPKCHCGNHTYGGECADCKRKTEAGQGILQRAAINTAEVEEIPPIVHEVFNSPGQPLDNATRADMERRFGHDFSQVRLHTTVNAARSAHVLNSRAFTVGHNIIFGGAQYSPHTSQGRFLLAHELVHTIQQSGNFPSYQASSSSLGEPKVSNIDNPLELQAQQMAEAVINGMLPLSVRPYISNRIRPTVQRQSHLQGKSIVSRASRLTRERFVELMKQTIVSTDTLASDPATAGIKLEEADTNRDGRISTDGERRILFNRINQYFNIREDEPLLLRSGDRITATGLIVEAIARLSGSKNLRNVVGTLSLANVVTLVGMSDTSVAEARALRTKTPVQLITDIPGRGDKVKDIDGQHTFDLSVSTDREAFVNTLKLPKDVQQKVLQVLNDVSVGARREIAELARVWSFAYSGNAIPRRVILSGHGDGTWITGDDQDFINKNSVLNLGRAMPEAAKQIYSFHIGSCQHGYDTRMKAFRQVFPSLQMIWGYAGTSPSGEEAQGHMIVWEQKTHNFPQGGPTIDPSREKGISGKKREKETSIWTPSGGWKGPVIPTFPELLVKVKGWESIYQQYLQGQLENRDPGHGFLYNYYQNVQQLSTHPGMDTQEEAVFHFWQQRTKQALRLRLYHNVAVNFQRTYQTQINKGYSTVGLKSPDFGKLNRGAALKEIRSFEQQMTLIDPDQLLLWTILRGLKELDDVIIPMSWVEPLRN